MRRSRGEMPWYKPLSLTIPMALASLLAVWVAHIQLQYRPVSGRIIGTSGATAPNAGSPGMRAAVAYEYEFEAIRYGGYASRSAWDNARRFDAASDWHRQSPGADSVTVYVSRSDPTRSTLKDHRWVAVLALTAFTFIFAGALVPANWTLNAITVYVPRRHPEKAFIIKGDTRWRWQPTGGAVASLISIFLALRTWRTFREWQLTPRKRTSSELIS